MTPVVKHENWLPRDMVEFPCVETFKTQLDTVLGNLLKQSQPEQEGWIMRSQEAASNLNDSVISCSAHSFKPRSHSS